MLVSFMELQEFKQYFKHVVGLNFFNIWLFANGIKAEKNSVTIPLNFGSRYIVRIQKDVKKQTRVSFVAEQDVIVWLSRLQFSRVVLDKVENRIAFILNRVSGDNENFQDFPEFAIFFEIDWKIKLDKISAFQSIDIKEFFIEDGELNFCTKVERRAPIVIREKESEPIFDKKELRQYNSFSNIQDKIIQKTNSFNSQYIGEDISYYINSMSDEYSKLLRPFDESRLQMYGLKTMTSEEREIYLSDFKGYVQPKNNYGYTDIDPEND